MSERRSPLESLTSLRQLMATGSESPKRYPYPEEVREDVLWLRGYVHDRFSDQLNALVEFAGRRGISRDYNYYYQVLTCRYFRIDQHGKVQGSVQNLQQIVSELRRYDEFAARLAEVRFVETSTWHDISDYIDLKSRPFSPCRFGGIIGYTGTQKSACYAEKARRAKPGQVIHFECPARANLSTFIKAIAEHIGGCGDSWSTTRMRNHIARTLAADSVVLPDNVQRCYDARRGRDQPVFNYMLELQETTKSTWIPSWTPDDLGFMQALESEFFEQFIGRMGGEGALLTLAPYPPDKDVALIAASFGVPQPEVASLLPRLLDLVKQRGRIRLVVDALQVAAQDAKMDGERFGAAHVHAYLDRTELKRDEYRDLIAAERKRQLNRRA